MANLKFVGSNKSESKAHNLNVYVNDLNEIYIEIDMGDYNGWNLPNWISLDIDTAVQFAKQLRKSIAEAKDNDQ